MLGVATHDLVSLDVVHVVQKDLLRQQVDESLDAISGLLRVIIVVALQEL